LTVFGLLSASQLNVVVSGDDIQPEFYGIRSHQATTCLIGLLLCGDWADIRLMLW
jgi:hypothetical protein